MVNEPHKEKGNLDELHVYGLSSSPIGADFPVICPNCKTFLTVVKLNYRCIINIDVKCNGCGAIARGKNLWAEIQ